MSVCSQEDLSAQCKMLGQTCSFCMFLLLFIVALEVSGIIELYSQTVCIEQNEIPLNLGVHAWIVQFLGEHLLCLPIFLSSDTTKTLCLAFFQVAECEVFLHTARGHRSTEGAATLQKSTRTNTTSIRLFHVIPRYSTLFRAIPFAS